MALFPCLLLGLLTFSLVTSTEMKMHEWGNNNSDIGLIFFPLSLSLVMMGLTNSTGRMVGYDGRVSWGKNENQAFRRRRQQFGNETQPPRCVSPKHSVGGYFHSPISDSIQYN